MGVPNITGNADEPQATRYTKRAIPEATRRAVALREGAPGTPRTKTPVACHYCGAAGTIVWMTKSWVYFDRLHLDHVVPEYLGGGSGPENIVLACRRCNLSKGWRRTAAETMRAGLTADHHKTSGSGA